jgi:hypothetical protein
MGKLNRAYWRNQGRGTWADGSHAEHLLIVGVNHGQHVLCDVNRCVLHEGCVLIAHS